MEASNPIALQRIALPTVGLTDVLHAIIVAVPYSFGRAAPRSRRLFARQKEPCLRLTQQTRFRNDF